MNDKMKLCDTCGHEIAIAAKTCPHCGAPNHRPVNKKVIGIIAVVIAACSIGAGTYYGLVVKPQQEFDAAHAMLMSGQVEEAYTKLQTMREEAELQEILYQAAVQLTEQKQYDSAEQIIGKLGEHEGAEELKSDINFARAQEAFDAKDYDKVLSLLRQDTSEEADNLKKEVNYERGKQYYEAGKYEKAMTCFNNAYNFKDAEKLYSDSQTKYDEIQIADLPSKTQEYNIKINEDIVGWLYIPNTEINYPVTHTNNNTYYLQYNIHKQFDRNGSLVADYECNFKTELPTNTVIFGNNYTNLYPPFGDSNSRDTMFAEVHKYADKDFAKNHPYIYFATSEKNYKYQVFAAFYTHVNWTDYLYVYPNTNRLSNILKTAKENTLHDFNVSVATWDKIISLSTGTRACGVDSDHRFVVMGKLLSD